MMEAFPVLVDSNNAYDTYNGRYVVRLTTIDSKYQFLDRSIELYEGLQLRCYSDDGDETGKRDDLVFQGVAHYSPTEGRWHVVAESGDVRHVSEAKRDHNHWANLVNWDTVHEVERVCVKRMMEGQMP